MQPDGQVVGKAVALVQAQPVDDHRPVAVRLEVREHRVRVQLVPAGPLGRGHRRPHGHDRLAEVRLEPELEGGDVARYRPVDFRRCALHVRVVAHPAAGRVRDAVVRDEYQRVANAREVLPADRQPRAARRYAHERLVAVQRRVARVLEHRVRHVLIQVCVEREPQRARGRPVAGARHARHFVGGARRHRARDVLQREHLHLVAGVQEVAADADLGAAGRGTARRPHARDLRVYEIERLVGLQCNGLGHQAAADVVLRHVRHLDRSVVQVARVGGRYGARDDVVLGRGRQQAPAAGHRYHDQPVLGHDPVVPDGYPHGRAAGPRPVFRLDGADADLGTFDAHVLPGRVHVREVGEVAHVAVLVLAAGALVVPRAPPAKVPVPVVVPEAARALLVRLVLVPATAVVPGHVVIVAVVELQRDAVNGHPKVHD